MAEDKETQSVSVEDYNKLQEDFKAQGDKLAKLEKVEIQNEKKDLMKLAESLEEILKNPVPKLTELFNEVKKKYGDARRTVLSQVTVAKEEKEIRSDAIKNARIKKESASLIRKYGIENIKLPDESVKEEIQSRDTKGFIDNMKLRRELQAYAKAVSVYERAVKPYTNAKNLIEQAENYAHYDEIEEKYGELNKETVKEF